MFLGCTGLQFKEADCKFSLSKPCMELLFLHHPESNNGSNSNGRSSGGMVKMNIAVLVLRCNTRL